MTAVQDRRTEPRPTVLEAEGLVRRFGGLTAVAGVSFMLRQKEVLGVIGPNGAGKSTTFDLLSGFRRPHNGTLKVFGKVVTGHSPRAIARQGLVRTFQHNAVVKDISVCDNILIGTLKAVRGARERDKLVCETAELVGLSEHLTEMARRLPHGKQRLLSIAIALASRPRILCLDEPLTGLNPVEAARTVEIIRQIRDQYGTSILFVEHNIRAVMSLCDRIIVLNYGKVLAEGTPEEVSGDKRVIDAYLGSAR
jgi:branched-chain amino acid transport system ATP-binding protein